MKTTTHTRLCPVDAETVRKALARNKVLYDGQVTEFRVSDSSKSADAETWPPISRYTSVTAADHDSPRVALNANERTAVVRHASCALSSELAASQDIIKSAVAVARDLNSYQLSAKENAALFAAFDYFVKSYDGTTATALIAMMKPKVENRGLSQLANLCLREVPVFGVRELARVAAYTDFRSAVLGLSQRLSLEVRCEGRRAYCLLQLEDTVLRVVEGVGSSLLWPHDEACAHARFRDGGEHLGLVGMQTDKSEFATASSTIPRSKAEALDLLGLRGSAAFDNPGGVLYCIRAAVTPELLGRARPMVPLLCNVASADHSGAVKNACVHTYAVVHVSWCIGQVVVSCLLSLLSF